MPNWCENFISIKGDRETLKLLEENFSFSFIRPEPNWATIPNEKGDLPSEPDEHGITSFPDGSQDQRWYHWRSENWGTKWDLNPDDTRIELANDVLDVWCLTAWGPPVEVLRHATERFPSLLIRIQAIEPGMSFYERCDLSNGVITNSVEEFPLDDMIDSVGDKSESRFDSVDLDFVGNFLDSYDGFGFDNENRRWDTDNRCWDRINDGYEWDEDEEYWRRTTQQAA